MGSDYDDELWEAVPEDPGPPPSHLVAFAASLHPSGDVLDLGCGDGRLTAELRAERITAADVSALARARARGRLPHAELVELDPDAPLPFADASFDLVTCLETIEHVRDVQRLLSEARRVLRPGGRLALSTPAHGRRTALRALLGGWDRVLDPLSPHLRHFSPRSLTGLVGEMGFRVESLARRRGSLLLAGRR
ncbi:MAG TPA: class I SAM-dependent methyltransferase [Thermoleophilaceae bacterium]|nr:class I SAM-dependent methyltransferase [Thermoleophilaceae bacterium]